MKFRSEILVLGFFLASAVANAQPAPTLFTYQGNLKSMAASATGQYDFKFALYSAEVAGTQIGTEQTALSVTVNEGLFVVPLDFGDVFDGSQRWLQISVRPAATGSYTILSPRQVINATPQALFAQNSNTAKSATTATVALNGVPSGFSILGDSQVPPPGYTWTKQTVGDGPHFEASTPMDAAPENPAGTVLNNQFYVGADSFFSRYDPITSTWIPLAYPSVPRHGQLSLATAGGKIFAMGGLDSFATALSVNESYDPVPGTWTIKASMPTPLSKGSICSVGNVIYRIDMQATEAYNVLTDSWSIKEQPPNTLGDYFEIAVLDGKCYCFGGNSACHLVYDPVKDDGPGGQIAWSSVSQMSTPTNYVTPVAYKSKIYCLGGISGSTVLSTSEIYDPVSDTWASGPPMFTARKFFPAGATDDTIIVAGGIVMSAWSSATEFLTGATFYVHVKN